MGKYNLDRIHNLLYELEHSEEYFGTEIDGKLEKAEDFMQEALDLIDGYDKARQEKEEEEFND